MNNHFDLIVIGCGPGGYKSAIIAAQLGYSVALIEKARPGGTCLNEGCVPKEALTRIAKLVDDVKSFNGLGLNCFASPNFPDAIKHKNHLIDSISNSVKPWLKRIGIHYMEGNASFVNKNTVKITLNDSTQNIIGDRIIIATGSRPKSHPTINQNATNIINSHDFMFSVNELPERVLCIGGGCIGTELGYVLNQFGSKVTIVENTDRLLNHASISERASGALKRKLKRLGINIKTSTRAITEITSDTAINVLFSDGSADGFDLVLIAIGREANTDNLQLENAGVKINEDGFIITDEYLETDTKGIYAIGDVKQGPMTANIAFHDAKIATRNALGGNKNTTDYNRVPIVIDSALQIASVGLTEEAAEDAGFDVEVARTNLAGTTKAQLTHDVDGFIEVVHDESTGQVLGGCVVGPQAREMIHTITAACQSDRGLWFFTDHNHAHPSWNEELENTIYRYINEFTPRDNSVEQQNQKNKTLSEKTTD